MFTIKHRDMTIKKDIKNNNGFIRCWEYFDCTSFQKTFCPAFINGLGIEKFKDCSLFIEDNLIGGPALYGPCAECEWNLKYGLLSDK